MRATLDALVQVLDSIAELVASGREEFDRDPRQRWSIERLWIHAGNLAEAYCREADIADGVEPWSELISAHNVYAHYRPEQVVHDRVWAETIEAIKRVRRAITDVQR